MPRDLEQGLYTEMRNSGDDRWRGSHNDASNPSSGLHGDQTINPTGDGLQSSEDRSVPDNQTEISERNTGRTDRDQQDASSTKVERNSATDSVRFRSDIPEVEQIKANSLANGTFMKAPNGADTNLSEHQWLQVRTKAFREWFGDWEKVARIEKLRNSIPVTILGNEITASNDIKQYRKNALEYGKTLRGEYLNKDTDEKINLTAGSKIGGIKEVLSHDYKDTEHLQSIAAVPKIIENATYIGTEVNTNTTKPDIVCYDYYVCGLKIGKTDYTVKAVVSQSKDGTKYYDHKLTFIEKGRLLTLLDRLSIPSADSKHPISDIKDKRLVSILQTNSSKVVDANGEPMVVYHGSQNSFTEFNERYMGANGTSIGQGFYFTTDKSFADGYNSDEGNVFEVFLNLRKNLDSQIVTIKESQLKMIIKRIDEVQSDEIRHSFLSNYNDVDYNGLDRTLNEAVESEMDAADNDVELIGGLVNTGGSLHDVYEVLGSITGHDGIIGKQVDGSTHYVVGKPNQIKSAIENSGDFSFASNDIRYKSEFFNQQFNTELQQQINSKLPKGHIYQLGMPSDALLNAGIPNLPIELNASRLSIKASKDYASDHPFELAKITNLPQAIANPIAVFDSKTQAGSKIILTELTDGVNNFVVAVKVNSTPYGYRNSIVVNDIRSIYPKDYVQDIINWINRGDLLRWVDKQKALNWLTQQRSNSAEVDNPIKGDNTSANIIKKFTNPTKSSFRDGDFQETTQSEPKNITEAIDQLERKFGVNVIRCENRKALPSNIRFRMSPNARYSGVYNNGQVYMILDEITDANDAIATYLHEVVSHKGIEGLLGKDKTNRLYTTIFDSLDNRTQRELLDRYGDKVIAGDEYCAEIAEGDVTPSVMQRVISAIREFFREVVGLPLRISDNDIRYILWKSAQKLQKATTIGESMRVISRDQDLRLELFDPVRFRKRKEVVSKEFNILDDKDKIEQNAIKVREVLQDDKIRIKLLQDLVLKRGGKVDVTKDLYSSLNRLDSITKTAMDKFERKFMNPLVEYISILEASDGSKITYEQVSDYVNAKHSIERHDSGVNALSEEEDGNWTREVTQNIVENFEAELSLDQLNQLWDYVRKATNEILLTNVNAGIMTSQTAKELIERWEYYVPLRGKDFDFENQINLAEYYDYVGGTGYGKMIQNVAGKKANGRISKSEDPLASIQHVGFLTIMYAERNKALMNAVRLVQSNSEMTDLFSLEEIWYRKRPDGTWEETDTVPTAEEVKASVTAKRNVNDIKKQLKEAKKQLREAKKDIKSKKDIKAKSDVIDELTERLNDAMDEVTVNKVAYSFGNGYKGISSSQKEQHYITVMKNGVAQRVRFTDVSIVNAINEINDSVIGKFARSKFGQKVGQGTRFLASISTSKNPAFILANYARDVQHAYLYNLVDSDGNANGYLKYAFTSFKPIHRYLLKQETPLTIAEMAGYDIKNTVDRVELLEKYGHDRVQDTLYDIFISNGGKTGYLHIENAKDYSRKLERQTRRIERHNTPHDWTTIAEFAHGFNVGMDYMAEMSETSTRFAVFLSQLDMGKDILTAVNYSKDITVNFNRKGKWGKGLGVLYLFYNAGVQGSFNAAKLGWKNKGKASLAIGAIAVMGYANSLLLEAMLAGDDDQKWKISDYEKRTNIIIPAFWTENGYMKIPIPILIRPAWNMGLVANDFLNGKVDATEAVKSIFSTSFNSMSPVDVDTESLGKAITPTIAKPILEIKTWNTDFAGRQINRDPFLASQKGYIPNSQLGQPYVHSILKDITTWLNKLGGGNEFVPAGLNWDGSKNYLTEWMDISPSTLEHILGSYTGGLGKEIMRAINFVTDDEARKQARNLPILT